MRLAKLYSDLYFHRALEDLQKIFKADANVVIYPELSTSVVHAWLPFTANVYCDMDFTRYPVDNHRCPVYVGSLNHDSYGMVFKSALKTDDYFPPPLQFRWGRFERCIRSRRTLLSGRFSPSRTRPTSSRTTCPTPTWALTSSSTAAWSPS